MTDAEYSAVFKLPFKEAETFFKEKLNIPTQKWDDLWRDEHAKGFMSAGAQKAELLAGLRDAVQKSIDGGMTKKEFAAKFDELAATHGWSYKGGRNWRSSLIYDTNITTAYQAGRWQQFRDGGTRLLQYVHADGVLNPRPQHLAWSGTVLPIDHAFWVTNYPPNGWRCHCRAVAVTDPALVTPEPKGWQEIDPKTDTQVGIDKGWDYNVGEAGMLSREAVLGEKLASLPPALSAPLYKEMAAVNNDAEFAQWVKAKMADTTESGVIKTTGEQFRVGFIDPEVQAKLAQLEKPVTLETTLITVTDKEFIHSLHLQDLAAGTGRHPERIIPLEMALELPRQLRESTAVLYDVNDPALIYLFDVAQQGKSGKWVVRVNFWDKRAKLTGNAVTTSAVLDDTAIAGNIEGGQYIEVWKK